MATCENAEQMLNPGHQFEKQQRVNLLQSLSASELWFNYPLEWYNRPLQGYPLHLIPKAV